MAVSYNDSKSAKQLQLLFRPSRRQKRKNDMCIYHHPYSISSTLTGVRLNVNVVKNSKPINCTYTVISCFSFGETHRSTVTICFLSVSNLSFLSKSLERVVQRRLQEFLDSNNLIPETQSAYRQYHSTETAVTNVYNDLLLAADQGDVFALRLLTRKASSVPLSHVNT